MTGSDVRTEDWAPFFDAQYYQADALSGRIRSLDRTIGGRFHKGVVLKLRPDPDGYLRVNYTDDSGRRHHAASVARCMLMAHDPDGFFPGAHACHGPGGRQDNRRANLRWDTDEANRLEALEVLRANRQAKPPAAAKTCPRCQAQHHGKGKNCPACVVKIGADGAALIVSGMRPDDVERQLDYPFKGVVNLAVIYGGLRFYRDEECIPATATGTRSPGRAPHPAISPVVIDDEVNATLRAIRHAPSPRWRSLSVLFRRGASRQNSDGG